MPNVKKPTYLFSGLAKVQTFLSVVMASGVLLGAFAAWFSGIAWSSDVEALTAKHDRDIKSIKVIIYDNKITEITLKPNKTQYDSDLLKHYQNK